MKKEERIKILIVDDTPDIITQLQQILISEGYDAFVANSGEKALQRLELNNPDLILLDIIMPGIDGYETCRRIKSDPRICHIPIVFMSALLEAFDKVKAFGTGAVDYITKPLNTEELLVRIKTHISISQLQKKLREANSLLEEKVQQRTSELQASEAKYRSLFENSQEGIWVIDKNNITTIVNPAMGKILGYTQEEMIGKQLFDFMDENGKRIANQNIGKKNQGVIEQHDFELFRKDGELISTTIEAAPLIDDKGEYIGAIAGVIDITDRKRAEMQLINKNQEYESLNEELKQTNDELHKAKERAEKSEERFRLAMEATSDGLWDWDIPTGKVYYSPGYFRILGFEPNELAQLINTWQQLIHPDDMENAVSTNEACINNNTQSFSVEFRMKAKDGSWRWILSRGKAFERDSSGKALRLIGTHVDITERKRIEEDLIKTKILLEQSFEQSPVPLVLVSMPDTIIRIANPACQRFLGIEDEPTIVNSNLVELKASWQDFNMEGNPGKLEELPLVRSLMGIKTEAEERYIIRKDGSIRYELVYGFPILNEAGQIIAGYHIMIDITDRKLAENKLKEREIDLLLRNKEYEALNEELQQSNDELQNAKRKAEESDHLKTAFLQNMSHEIRTPMNAIIGFSGFLNKSDLSEEKRKSFISIIINSTNQLLSIVNDILTISAVETKQEKIKIQPVFVNDIIVDLLAIFKTQALNQNISLYAKQQLPDVESEIYTDNTKVIQILTNLLTNALKFTHEGYVEFGYTLVETQNFTSVVTERQNFASVVTERQNSESVVAKTQNFASLQQMQFYVKDTGIGISIDQQEKIFERFRQADLSITKKYGGTGLGLSISKGFAELLGGKIWVESEPGKGSTFYFSIPYNPVQNSEISITQANQNKKTILVAEDEEFNFLLIEELLINLNFKLIHAKEGKETVEIFKSNPNIDLILMDIKMPVMDGHTAALIIKKLRPDMPIIAQSAYALEHEIEKFSGKAFDDYIIKPIDENELKQKVLKYIEKK